jgi:hypothetical protein
LQLVHFDRRFAGTNNPHLGHRLHKATREKMAEMPGS